MKIICCKKNASEYCQKQLSIRQKSIRIAIQVSIYLLFFVQSFLRLCTYVVSVLIIINAYLFFDFVIQTQQMRSLTQSAALMITILQFFILLSHSATLTIDSTSSTVGVDCNYTITLVNQTTISSLTFSFTNWTKVTTDPFYLSRTQLVYSSTTLTPVGVPGILKFTPSAPWVGSNFTFILTNMRNPSSTKPYLITLTVDNGSTTSVFTANLTRTTVSNSSFTAINYSLLAGATSSSAQLYITPQYSLLQNGSVMSITYNNNVISLSASGSSSYTVVSTTTGRVVIGNFSTQSYNLLQVAGLTIANPQAVTTHTIVCLFYINESGTIYNIQNFTRTFTLTPAPYSTLSTTTTLPYGTRTNLSVVLTTPYTPKNNGTILAYTILNYSISEITFLNTTNCVAVTSTTCKLATVNSTTVTEILSGIGNFAAATLTFTLYTYYNITDAFVPLCQSNLAVNYSLQSINAASNTGLCTNFTVAGQNNITLSFTVSSVAAGDTVYITGFRGIPSTPTWTAITVNSKVWYYYTLKTGNLATVNSTTSTVLIYLPYFNNNYTLTSTNITSLNIYRSGIIYSSSSSTPSLCPVTTPLQIVTSSLATNTLQTYSANKISLDVSLQFFDYAAGDYLIANFRSSGSGSNYLLAGSYIGVSCSVTVNGLVSGLAVVNDTALKIILTSNMLPTSVNTLLKIVFSNIVNPPMQQTIFIQLTTYQSITSGIKETLNSNSFSTVASTLSSSTSNLQLLSNNTLSLLVSNPNRYITNKNLSLNSSMLTVSLPSVLNCSLVTNSTSITWNTVVQTSTPSASGNTTHLTINLGVCYVSFFTGSISYVVTQKYGNVLSTSTSISTANICNDGCYECTSNTCTKCFNSTNSNLTLLYEGVCYQTCPTSTYKSDVGACTICHSSCSVCSAGYYMNCTTCATSFQFTPSSYCLSICGSNKYLAGSCMNCHINCQACLSEIVCYVCKANATLIGSVCEFTSCFSPCLSCMGNQANCTACISGYSFYQSSCVSSCPSGTYKSSSGNNESICLTISQPVLYVPLSIVGAILMMILFGLRAYASKKIGNHSKRSRFYKSEESENINYKLNCWRMGSVVYTYLQIIGGLVMAMKNSSYALAISSTMIVGLGLILHLISNIVFVIGFCLIVLKKKIRNDKGVQPENNEQQQNSNIRYKIVTAMSAIVSFRTYKILFANLFVEKNMSTELRMTEKAAYPNQETFNQLSTLQQTVKGESVLTKKLEQKQSKIIISDKFKKNQKKGINNSNKQSPRSPRSPRSPNSKKPIVHNAPPEDTKEQPTLKLTQTYGPLPQLTRIYYNKKFNHPFLTYLTIVNLLSATLVIVIGCIIQIMGQSFVNMLWWGIDCLIVSIISFGLTSWDLWSFVNLKRQEQHSQMSSNKNEVNQTHQNLKQAAQIQIQVDMKNQKKYSPKKLSMLKPSFSNRSTQKRKENDQNQQLPVLKVFDDFDQKDNTVLKQAKTKKFSTKNLRYGNKALSKRQASIVNTKRNIHGELCDDIYINFQSQKLQKQATTTTFMKSRGSISPRSLKQQPNKSLKQGQKSFEKEEQKQLEFDELELDEQPPNFANISDIEQVKASAHNVTISSGLIQEQIQ